MKARKYHRILLLVSVSFMMAHNLWPHQHDHDFSGERYSAIENRGDLFLLIKRALTSDLGESHLEDAVFQEVGCGEEPIRVFNMDHPPMAPVSYLHIVNAANPGTQHFISDHRGKAWDCRPLRAPPFS